MPQRNLWEQSPSEPQGVKPFESDDETLEAFDKALKHRERHVGHDGPEEAEVQHDTLYRRLAASQTPLALRLAPLRLSPVEIDCVVALLLEHLNVLPRFRGVRELSEFLTSPGVRNRLRVARALSPQGRLCQEGILYAEDSNEQFSAQGIGLDPTLIEAVLAGTVATYNGLLIQTEEELSDHLYLIARLLARRSEGLRSFRSGYGNRRELGDAEQRLRGALRDLERTLDLHPGWRLSEFRAVTFPDLGVKNHVEPGWSIFLALLAKELGHIDADDRLVCGEGLAAAVSGTEAQIPRMIRWLGERASEEWGWIRPSGGADFFLDNTADALSRTEFELTPETVENLGLRKDVRRRWGKIEEVRTPHVTFEQLVLPHTVAEAVDLLVAQVRHAEAFEAWGLPKVFPYGRGVTAVFHGPPGCGKTACAEALANALDKPILVANYAEIEGCYVGQTEKALQRLFRLAQRYSALLFLDECDAVAYTRSSEGRSWENRQVSVLLAEVEAFTGVCIFATNRVEAFDAAFERRITVKVRFDRPNQGHRRAILEKLVPREVPLASDVDFDAVAQADLSGGELKNVVLNAIRRSLHDTQGKGPVAQNHFIQAMEAESRGRFASGATRRIGFTAAHAPDGSRDGVSSADDAARCGQMGRA